MTWENAVSVTVKTGFNASATSFDINPAIAPMNNPPTDGGKLVLTDHFTVGIKSKIEIVSYTSTTDNGTYLTVNGVTRGVNAESWVADSIVSQNITREELNKLDTIAAGATANDPNDKGIVIYRGVKSGTSNFDIVTATRATIKWNATYKQITFSIIGTWNNDADVYIKKLDGGAGTSATLRSFTDYISVSSQSDYFFTGGTTNNSDFDMEVFGSHAEMGLMEEGVQGPALKVEMMMTSYSAMYIIVTEIGVAT